VKAFVLIQTETNSEPIAGALRAIPGVECAEDLTGPYDAIAYARSDSTKGLMEQVVDAVRRLPGVIRAISAPRIGSLRELAAPPCTVEAA
jgi:AsnC-like helix-turn-helix protein